MLFAPPLPSITIGTVQIWGFAGQSDVSDGGEAKGKVRLFPFFLSALYRQPGVKEENSSLPFATTLLCLYVEEESVQLSTTQ